MGSYGGGERLIAGVATWLVVGVLAIIALKLALLAVGAALRLGLVLLLTVGPILLVGWMVLKLLRRFAGENPSTGY
jgi:hypothetical protein